MKRFLTLMTLASSFLFSSLVYAIPNYDGPNSDEITDMLTKLGSVIKEFFSFLF